MRMPAEFVGETDRGQGEDCLYLNVWSRAKSPDAHLPVMVWIHGGGFQFGSGSLPLHDGTHFAEQGVVLVTFNYRLGVLGFLAQPELTAESGYHSSGNYGLLDQIAALEWVRDNIAAFGGDPERVTIFGESAGSTAISILQASPLAKGLFQRVIGESTSQMDAAAGMLGRQTLGQAEQYGEQFEASVGAHSLADLRRMPVDALLKEHKLFWPLIDDGHVLPGDVYSIFAAGRQNDVPTLVGSNSAEGTTLRVPWIKPESPAEQAGFAQLYSGPADPQVYTDTVEWQARSWAGLQAQTGHSKSYLYWFDQPPPAPADKPQGPIHGAEIVYVFQNFSTLDWRWTATDRRVGALMSRFWVNFAKTGDPNGPGLPHWPAYDPKSPQVMDITADSHAMPAPRENAYEFIDTYFASRRGAAAAAPGDDAAAQSHGAAQRHSVSTRGPGGVLDVELSHNGAELAASVPDLALDPHDRSRVYVVWRYIAIAKDVPGGAPSDWECHLSISTDGGEHFQDQVLEWNLPDTPGCNAPYVDVANDGHVYVGATLAAHSAAATGGPGHLPFGRAVIKASSDGGLTWGPTVSAIASDSLDRFAENASIPEAAKHSPWDGARGVIDHDTGDIYVSGGFPAPPNGVLHSQRFFTLSTDGGRTFGVIRAFGSESWPQRWDSHIIAAHGVLAFSYVAGAAPLANAKCPCVVFATSADHGATIVRHYIGPVNNLDTLVHYPPIAADPKRAGRYALSMVSDDKQQLTVEISRDAGAHWRPLTLQQPAEVTTVSRPALAFSPDGTLVVMWRGYHADGGYDVYLAAGKGNGMGAAVKITTASSNVPAQLATHYAVRGDFINVVAADRDTVHATWTDWRDGAEARVYYGRIPVATLLAATRQCDSSSDANCAPSQKK